MRIVALGLVSAALVAAGAALAIGPPQPPSPDGIATTVKSATSPTPTGLFGHVSRGPTTPNCDANDPCFQPVQVTLRFSRQGRLVVRTATRVSGAYRIALRPGVYS